MHYGAGLVERCGPAFFEAAASGLFGNESTFLC
jgi:hypothetical protein